jgi:FkbM family methyltransferase
MSLKILRLRAEKFLLLIGSRISLNALFFHRVLVAAEHRFVLKARGGQTVVDIGANRGQFALAARQWAPNARVISFEPLPGPAAIFRSVFVDDAQVMLHESAIGPKEESLPIHVSARDDSSSLLPIAEQQSQIFPGTEEVGTQTVRVAPLDVFIKPEDIRSPALLKLDVQGYEYEALQGCESLLSCFDSVYCECSFVELYEGQKLAADVIAWLAARGFQLKGIYNTAYGRDGLAIQADFLFEKVGL